jgi:Protein of unknown function (DUF3761)
MKLGATVLAAVFAALLFVQPEIAGAKKVASPTEQQATTSESELASHGHYVNKDKQVVHSPSKTVTGKAPSGASAHCRDGSYSFSRNHRGTCSHHGGVVRWLN